MKKVFIALAVLGLMLCGNSAGAWYVDTTTQLTTVRYQVPNGWYDGYYTASGDSTHRTNPRVICYPTREPAYVGFRGVAVGQGEEIIIATCSLYVYSASYDDLNMNVFAEDTGNADSLKTSSSTEITARNKTTASDLWITEDVEGGWQSDTITSLIQEVVDREDWESGGNMGLIFEGETGTNGGWYAYEGWDIYSAVLYIKFNKITSIDTLPNWEDLGDSVIYITGTSSIDDTHLLGDAAKQDYSSGDENHVFTLSDYRRGMVRVNTSFSSLIPYDGATIVSFVCSTFKNTSWVGDTVSAYECFKPWVEGAGGETACVGSGATWNDWACLDSEWTTAGCNNADDEGVFNNGDGTGADRKATAEASVIIGGRYWYGFDLTALGQRYYDGTSNQSGGIVFAGGWLSFHSTENPDSNQVFFVLTYSLPATATKRLPFIKR